MSEDTKETLAECADKGGYTRILTAGFPCQDVSIAGKRRGLTGKQTGLWFELARIIKNTQPEWIVLENVPGLLSSRQGQDMAQIITTLSEVGYCVVWTSFDAQYFGVAQRRKRVWIIGSFRNFGAAKVLALLQGSERNDRKIKKVGQRGLCLATRTGQRYDPTAETFVASTLGGTIRGDTSFVWQDTYIAEINAEGERKADGISGTLDAVRGKALGNAIVPQVAYQIFMAIKEVEQGGGNHDKSSKYSSVYALGIG